VLADCVGAVDELSGDGHARVGIGICEAVDREGGLCSAQTIDWRDVDLGRAFAPHRIALESDVRAAAGAEATFGAGRDVDQFLFLSVGSGISYCLVEDRAPRLGARGLAIIVGAPPVEELSSGSAIAAEAGVATAEEALADDRYASVIERAAHSLGLALAALINALDPALVVVGGGLGLVDEYRGLFARVARDHLWAPVHLRPEIVPAALGSTAGLIGAALSVSLAPPALAPSHDR
jgi:glucokinase